MASDSNFFIDKILINKKQFKYFSLEKTMKFFDYDIKYLPFSYRILIENLIRKKKLKASDISECKNIVKSHIGKEIFFSPSRVLMQDYTGVPAIADLAAMRDMMAMKKKDPELINPLVPVSLVVDHSI